MELSNLALNLRGPWMISPEEAAAITPIIKGVLRGYITEFDKGPSPCRISCDALVDAPAKRSSAFAGKSIYVTYLTGTMLKYDSCGEPGARTIGNALLDADADSEIIGHILVADSGGGAVDAVDELAAAIRQLSKPIVGFIDGLAASACIYTLSYCNRIIAHNEMDTVGCIGTMCEVSGWPAFHKDPDGMVHARIYADSSADKNGAYEQALQGNFQVIREERLNPRNEKFIADMKANRPDVRDDQLTGKDYFARDVVGTLIDSIGSFDDAMKTVLKLAEEQLQQTGEQQNHQTINMETKNNYPHLVAIPALTEQVFDADGSTTMQPSQLEAVEAALADAAGHQDTIAGLQADLKAANDTIAARDARIKELEDSLQAAIERAEGAAPAGIKVNHAPEGGAQEEIKPAESFDDAMATCREFLKK